MAEAQIPVQIINDSFEGLNDTSTESRQKEETHVFNRTCNTMENCRPGQDGAIQYDDLSEV